MDLPHPRLRHSAADPPDREAVCGLGDRKQETYRALLDERGAETVASVLELVGEMRCRPRRAGGAADLGGPRQRLPAAGGCRAPYFPVRGRGRVSLMRASTTR